MVVFIIEISQERFEIYDINISMQYIILQRFNIQIQVTIWN